MYIYKTTNLITGKFYIGKRVYRKKDDNWYLGSGIYLKRAIKKYGREFFIKEIIEWCKDKETLCEREKYWIVFFDATNSNIGYNLSGGGDGGNVGKEAYQKISLKLKRIKRPTSFGVKVSKALKGKKKSKEHIEKVRQALLGKKRSPEIIVKMSETIKKKYNDGWQSPVQKEVHQYNKQTGFFIQSFKSATEASRLLLINRKAITNNCLKKTKSSGGFIWSHIKYNNINEG